jgi:hypothetical protein
MTTAPDFRALCAKALHFLELINTVGTLILTDEIKAALATLPPVPPTDEEIMELMPQQMRDDLANAARALAGFDRANVKAAGAMRIFLNRHAVDHARAVLERWGRA